MAEHSLKDKTVKGTIWSGIDNIAQYAVSFVVSIILARLLSPDDYGLLGIIAIFTIISTALINGGFTTALIRKKECTEADYSTAFVTNLGVSFLLYALLFAFSPLIADFFNRAELVLLTRVSSIGLILGALSLVQQTRLTKSLDFKTQTKITLVSSVLSGIMGIILALLGMGVWALVAQNISLQLIKTILLWVFNSRLSLLLFSKDSFRELFGYGWKLMIVSLIDTTWKQLNQLIVGKFYTPSTLGQYTRANSLSEMLSNNLTNVIQRVTFPVLSEIQDDKERMVNAYRKIIRITMFVTAVCMFSLGAASSSIIFCLFGPKWNEAALYLPLICVIGSMYPLHAINLNMLAVQGRSDLFLILEIIKKIFLTVPLLIGAIVGIMPMLWAGLFVGIICFFLNSYYSGKLLGYSSWMQIKDIVPSYSIALLVAIPVWLLNYLTISSWIILTLQVVLGATVFTGACRLLKSDEYEEVKKLVAPIIKKAHSNK